MRPASPYREPRNLLILLGFICQGYSFAPASAGPGFHPTNYIMPAVYALFWWVCLRFQRSKRFLPDGGEDLITGAAIIAAFLVGRSLTKLNIGYNPLVFIGNGLVIFQAMRLLRPLDLREKKYSIAVALIHFGVGSQVVVDYEFILLLLAAIYLIPRSLFDLEAEQYRAMAAGSGANLNRRDVAIIVGLMVLFFIAFPRFHISHYSNPFMPAPNQRNQIDPSDSSTEPGEVLLFRIQGPQLSYVKRTVLDTWDGTSWTASHWVRLSKRNFYGNSTDGTLHRTVKINLASALENYLPSDGHVMMVSGSFPERPYVADSGGIMVNYNLRRNLTYEYWTLPTDELTELTDRDRVRYLELPPESTQLRQWLDTTTAGLTDPDAIAQKLVDNFQTNHQYELGAPELDRQAPIDDFVLNQRNGHCERFASALTVLLRMKGIPARVVLGWLATERNDLGDFYNIRPRHGHAWTEAWIDGRGWVTYDATPYGTGINLEERSLRLTVAEWIEYVWYSKIVEFSSSDQEGLVNAAGKNLQLAISFVVARIAPIAGTVGVLILLGLFIHTGMWRRLRPPPRTSHEQAVIEARHFYGRMLRLLARQRLHRPAGQTPWEFLRRLEQQRHPFAADVRQLTTWFCDIRYGQRPLTADLRRQIDRLLSRIAKRR